MLSQMEKFPPFPSICLPYLAKFGQVCPNSANYEKFFLNLPKHNLKTHIPAPPISQPQGPYPSMEAHISASKPSIKHKIQA